MINIQRYSLTFILSILSFILPFYTFSWSHCPSTNVNITAFCCDSSETRIIINLQYGGFWKTEDGGENWIPINENMFSDPSARANECFELFTIDSNCDTIFAKVSYTTSTDWQYVFSVDGGQSWIEMRFDDLPRYNYGNFIRIDRTNHNRYFHVNPRVIRISEDFFENWSMYEHDPYAGQTYGFIQSQFNDSTLFISSFAQRDLYPGGIYRSLDKGRTWTPLIYPEQELGLYYVLFEDVLECSNGEILTFPTMANIGPLPNSEMTRLKLIMRSNDLGETWSIDSLEVPDNCHIQKTIEIPEQPGTLLLKGWAEKGGSGLFISRNYGQSFQEIEDIFPETNVCVNTISINEFSNTVYACINGYGVWKTDNGAITWTQIEGIPENLGRTCYYSISENFLFMKGELDNRLSSYSFVTDEWHDYPNFAEPRDTSIITSTVIGDIDNVLFATEKLVLDDSHLLTFGLRKSTDNGATWSSTGQRFLGSISYLNDPFVYWGQNKSRIIGFEWENYTRISNFIVSVDTGRTWSQRNFPTITTHAALFTHTDTTLYASVPENGIFKSYDDGETWIDMEFPEDVSWHFYVPMSFDKLNNILYVFTANRVYLHDGNQWEALGNYYQWPRTIAMVPGEVPKFFIAYIDKRITASLDGGNSWFVMELEFPYAHQIHAVFNIKYDPWRDRIWVMTGLGPMYINVEDVTGVSDEPVSLYPPDFELLTSYPNPFNENSRIVFNLKETDEIKLELFDITGRQVQTVIEGSFQAGKHEAFLDGSQLASGIYFLKLNTSEGVRTHKVTLVK